MALMGSLWQRFRSTSSSLRNEFCLISVPPTRLLHGKRRATPSTEVPFQRPVCFRRLLSLCPGQVNPLAHFSMFQLLKVQHRLKALTWDHLLADPSVV